MKHTEDSFQYAVTDYLDLKGLLWCHVENERKTTWEAGKRRKKKGVKKGVPDVLIFDPPTHSDHSNCIGVALELKVGKRKATTEQEKWLDDLHERNWFVSVLHSIDEVMRVIDILYK